MVLERAIAEAYLDRQQAGRLSPHDPKRREALLACGISFEEAASLSKNLPGQMKKLHHAAADCFMQVGGRMRAARAYYNAERYTDATSQYKTVGAYDEAVEVVLAHRPLIDPAVAKDLISVARLAYVKTNQLQ
jgi:hypothetical protein